MNPAGTDTQTVEADADPADVLALLATAQRLPNGHTRSPTLWSGPPGRRLDG